VTVTVDYPLLAAAVSPERIAHLRSRMLEDDNGCWIWQGATADGYSRAGIRAAGRQHMCLVHRLMYHILVGPVPVDLDMDHLCRVRACCNPAHLEPVTLTENNRRKSAAMTHCKHGHEINDDNSFVYTSPDGRTSRRCRPCAKRRSAERRAREASQRLAQPDPARRAA
jgi:hypothetical protein